MNNSQLIVDSEPFREDVREDIEPKLQAEEARLIRIIEALQKIEKSKEWNTLKIEVFDNLVNVLEKDIKTEARKDDRSLQMIARISGELKWAEKYADLGKLESDYRLRLQSVRKQLNGTTE